MRIRKTKHNITWFSKAKTSYKLTAKSLMYNRKIRPRRGLFVAFATKSISHFVQKAEFPHAYIAILSYLTLYPLRQTAIYSKSATTPLISLLNNWHQQPREKKSFWEKSLFNYKVKPINFQNIQNHTCTYMYTPYSLIPSLADLSALNLMWKKSETCWGDQQCLRCEGGPMVA